MNSNYYNSKLLKLEETFHNNNNNLTKIKDLSKSNTSKITSLKELFSSEYKKIIEDLSTIIDFVSSGTGDKKVVEEESPASIIRSLNLSWMNHSSCEENLVTNNCIQEGSYWNVESEQILDGPFLCKVEIEEITSLRSYWTHMFGIIKANDTSYVKNSYYNNCILMCSNGFLAEKYSGSGSYKLILREWQTGDVLIVKRDHNNTIYFGINDEYDMKEAFTDITGEFRICIGFSCIHSDKFRMTYLNVLG